MGRRPGALRDFFPMAAADNDRAGRAAAALCVTACDVSTPHYVMTSRRAPALQHQL